MSNEDKNFLERALRVRDQLAERLLDQPEVSLIDIGRDPQDHGDSPQLVVRVHIRQAEYANNLAIPEEMDGIPIRVIVGDYRLQ